MGTSLAAAVTASTSFAVPPGRTVMLFDDSVTVAFCDCADGVVETA